MKRIALISLAFMLMLIPLMAANCDFNRSNDNADEEAIEDTIDGYISSYNSSDFDKCITYFTGYDDEEDAKAQLEFLRGLSGEIGPALIKVSHISNMSYAGWTTKTIVSFTADGQVGIGEMQLKKVDGEWKILWDYEDGGDGGNG